MPRLALRLAKSIFQRPHRRSSRQQPPSAPSCIERLEGRTLLSIDPLQLGALAGPADAPHHGPEVAPGRWIAVLNENVDASEFAQELRGRGREVSHVFSHAVRAVAFRGEALKDDPRIAWLEPDLILQTTAQTLPTGINRINAELNTLAKIDGLDERVNVDIAVLDTGIDTTHPDLYVYAGRNFTGGSDADYDDRNGHGTHVAGTAAALDNGSGVVGVAPGARLWAAKVLSDNGSGYLSDIIAGVDWVTANAGQIEVANMSLGGTGQSSTFRTAIQNSVAAGVVYVVAAGNSGVDVYGNDKTFGTSDDYLPASYPEVMTVSALADSDGKAGGTGGSTSYGSDDSFASFSNYSTNVISGNPVNSPGAAIDLLMPGVNIYSTYIDGQYATMSGTSMAAPHAAGLAALFIAANGRDQDGDGDHDAQDVYAIRQALINGGVGQNTSNGLAKLNDPDSKWENIGWAEAIQPQDQAPTVAVTSPASGATVSGTVVLSADAKDDEGVAKVEFFVGQTSLGTDSDGSNGWSVAWNTTSYADGTYTLTAVATDTAGQTASHSISAAVDNVDSAPTVALTNPKDGASVSGIVSVSADAKDDKGIARVEFFVGTTLIGTDTDGGNGWAVSWNTQDYVNGSYTVTAVATDSSGQTATHAVTANVNNTVGSTNDMYVWEILWGEKRRGSRTDLYVTVDVNRDSDADAVAESGDAAMPGAMVTLVLAHDSDHDGVFEIGGGDQYWVMEAQTNDKGQLRAVLQYAPKGDYMAWVYDLTHSTATWNSSLDAENPDFWYGLPGGSESLTAAAGASVVSAGDQPSGSSQPRTRFGVEPSLAELAAALERGDGVQRNAADASGTHARAGSPARFASTGDLPTERIDELFASLSADLSLAERLLSI